MPPLREIPISKEAILLSTIEGAHQIAPPGREGLEHRSVLVVDFRPVGELFDFLNKSTVGELLITFVIFKLIYAI